MPSPDRGPARLHKPLTQLSGRAPAPQGKLVESPLAKQGRRSTEAGEAGREGEVQGGLYSPSLPLSPPSARLHQSQALTSPAPRPPHPSDPQERRRPQHSPASPPPSAGDPLAEGSREEGGVWGAGSGRRAETITAKPRPRLGGVTPSSGRRGRLPGRSAQAQEVRREAGGGRARQEAPPLPP